MRRLISYSLFGAREEGEDGWEFQFYVRGLYFNVLMNKIVYPGYETTVTADDVTFGKYRDFFMFLDGRHGVVARAHAPESASRSMLWRMAEVFGGEADIVLCRDADALTSYREAQAVQEWAQSECVVHSIHDNVAHTVPLLGGTCGFRGGPLRDRYGSLAGMLARGVPVSDRKGGDQELLSAVVYRDFERSMMLHNIAGTMWPCSHPMERIGCVGLPNVNASAWTSNLCSFFIGAAGCNEMETLRFFRDHLPGFQRDRELWVRYPRLFYWA